MERFIVSMLIDSCTLDLQFKIQYGEIYSEKRYQVLRIKITFKIQYGEIYRQHNYRELASYY